MALRSDRDPAAPALQRLLRRAEQAILAEKAWRALLPLLIVIALFLTVSWSGVWLRVEPLWRMVGVAVFAAAALAALSAWRGWRRPSRDELIARADGDGAIAHHPIAATTDALATGQQDEATRALWDLHQRRAAAALAKARPAAPRPDLAGRDPWALRTAVILGAVAAATVAGPEWRGRIATAFDWTTPVAPGPVARIDGWIDPPPYTRVAPIMLALTGESARSVTPPLNSTIVLRASNAPGIAITAEGGLGDVKSEENGAVNTTEKRFLIAGKGSVTIRRDGQLLTRITLDPIPDLVPLVTLPKPPQQNGRGSLTIIYKFEDDYGIASAEAQFKPVPAKDAADTAGAHPLVDPPTVQLSLPPEPGGIGEGQTIADLASHPWAGARVRMTITAKDEAGQEGTSDTIEVTLPQRPFSNPLAKALIEQRRALVMDARKRTRIMAAIDALMINPERFTPQPGVWLGLKTAHNRLGKSSRKEDLLDVAEYLWGMAVFLEDGDLSQAERDLRAAQEALRQALERGATDEEIKKLMQDLRAALDKYMQQLAEQMRRDGRDPQDARPMGPNDRVITQQDLQKMLDRMEQMARNGAREEARKMLDDMQKMLENLQTARPQRRQQNQQAREMNRALEDLDRMIREQQQLRDETFQNGQQQGQQQRRNPRADQRNQNRQAQRGQQGQRQQGQRGQQGQQGQEGQEGQDGQEGQEGEQGEGQQGQNGQGQQGRGQSLAQRQEQLRQRLENLRNRMRGMGQNGQQMAEAEEAMRDAERQLGQGSPGEAADSQGRALDALRRGGQQMAQQMMDGMGDPNGEQAEGTDNSSPGNPDRDRRRAGSEDSDPLGRPPPTRDAPDTSRYRLPGASAAERSQRVLEELRRRLSDPSRPLEELDYLRRLLRPY